MKDYYQTLGVKEQAFVEEIEARWAELMKEYRSRLHKGDGKAAEEFKEIREAYEVLTDPSKRKEYDFERFLKRSILRGIEQRRKERHDRKRLIIPVGIVVLLLVGGLFAFKMALFILRQKPAPVTRAPVPEAEKVSSPSKPVSGEISKGPDQKSPQEIPEQIVKSQEAISPAAKLPEKELEPKEKIAKETLKNERAISKEMPKPISEERPKVKEPKPVSTESRPVIADVPVSEGARKPEVAKVGEKEKPKATPKEMPKEVSRALPKEESKTILPEPPVPQPSRPIETVPTDRKSQVAQIPPAKPEVPIAAIPPMRHPFVTEQEVRQFLARYVDRYTQRDIEGFLSFFSSMAIQNQKDGIEEIKRIYSKQFEVYEKLKYQLKDPEIEILEKSVKVRASYEIDQFSKKGETKQLRGEIEWNLVKEGGELKILAIRYRREKPK